MKTRAIILTCALCAVLFLAMPAYMVKADNLVQYKVQLNPDGSAVWTITQAADLNGTIDTWQGFQQRIANLISTSRSQTQRDMSLDNESLQLNTVWENQSQTTEYQFNWLNFSVAESGKLIFGDVFQVTDFFSQLYGDGEIQVNYPTSYNVQSVSPQPNGGDTAPQTLDWLGTQFFVSGNPNVVLAEPTPSPTPSPTPTSTPNQEAGGGGLQLYALLASGITVAIVVSLVAFFVVRRRKTAAGESGNARVSLPLIESEEEKILKALQASGGSAYQSAITETCRFSKAKTSQLLSTLEKKGVVTRYKKGRDKIVNLTKKSQGESS
jgi:uncharacterized membrane protein